MLARFFGFSERKFSSHFELKISPKRRIKQSSLHKLHKRSAEIIPIRRNNTAVSEINKRSQSIQEILFSGGIKRFNAVLDGSSYISVTDSQKQAQNPFSPASNDKHDTTVRLWSLPGTKPAADDLHPDHSQLQIADELCFNGMNASVTQSPDMSLIAVSSENLIGVYEIKIKDSRPYFNFHSSYILPENTSVNKVTFHAGSVAITISTSAGDIDWIEIKSGSVNHLEPKNHDRVKIQAKTIDYSLMFGGLMASNA